MTAVRVCYDHSHFFTQKNEHMKNNILLTLIAISLLVVACNKDHNDPDTTPGTMSARFDGQLQTFRNVTAFGITSNDRGVPVIVVGGIAEGTMTDAMYISVYDEELLAIEQFSATKDCWGDTNCVWINYNINEGTASEYNLSSGDVDGSSSQVLFSTLDFRLDGKVSGTFSGVFINNETNQQVQVTVGKFEAEISDMQ